eukprot:GILI01009994.1.p1 GENE.GILI01009994.1~~GILI01009994.1.p1  ORF type:complete len:219 (+),score=60.52 GILI01009994.1:46-702(+)
MATLLKLAALGAAIIGVASATNGGDVSELYGSDTYSCCANNGWSFVIVRSYCSYGAVDSNAPGNLAAAQAGGITYTDIYHFPCYGGVDPSQQISDDFNAVGQGNFGMMWIDIETNPSGGCGWSGSASDNCDFLSTMLSEGQSLGINMGVYSSAYMWSSIMGGCTAGSDAGAALWYAHYDGNPSFDDFGGFGGWSTPSIKQYGDSVGICGINADADWYP